MGRPVVVLTHSVPDGGPRDDAPFTFVTDGIESAIAKAKELAGDNVVGVNGGTIARQLDGPTAVVEGNGVTHLRYRVRR